MIPCFLCANPYELDYLLKHCKTRSVSSAGYAKIYDLEYEGKPCVAVLSGVGKVLASSAATAAILLHPEVDVLINLGVGGSLDAEKAPLLSVVLGERYCQHDMDITGLGCPKGYLDGLDQIYVDSPKELLSDLGKVCDELGEPYTLATIASGDQFLSEEEKKAPIVSTFGALLIDMETAAFAEICHVHHKPFASVRVISDAVDHKNEYPAYKDAAAEKACRIGLAYLVK